MAAGSSGLPIYADTTQLSQLAKQLRAASKVVWKAYRVAAAAGMGVVLRDAQGRASYSSQIPASGRVRVTAAGNPEIVFTAPNATPIENKGKGFVRHPLFGDREHWYGGPGEKGSRPAFAAPALATHQAEVLAAIEKALVDAVGRALGGI
jgi:hypothetical protein